MKIGSGSVAQKYSGKIKEFKKNSSLSDGLLRLKAFSKKTKVKAVVCVIVVIAIITGIYFYKRYQSFDSYKVIDSIKVDSSSDSKYESYGDFVIKYSSDGISYIDGEETAWDESFEMKSPIVDICDDYIAVADKNTNDIYIYDEDGKVGKASTSYPIIKIEVASQGVVAALLEDTNANYIEVFDKEGNKLVSHKTLLNENGYPLNFSLSENGTKMMVSYVTINSGVISNKILFYNFSRAGQNSSDKVVGEFNQYEETLVPMVQFVSENTAIAVGENVLSIYSMKDKPSLKEELKFKDEIEKVFYGNKYIGFVFKNTNNKNPYRIEVYNLSGKRIMKKELSTYYKNIAFSGENVLMYDDMNCKIISFRGVEKFNYIFKGQINNIIPVDGNRTFLIMSNSKIQKVRLK
jgi:hypothetical protein